MYVYVNTYSVCVCVCVCVCACLCVLERPCVVARENARFRLRDNPIVNYYILIIIIIIIENLRPCVVARENARFRVWDSRIVNGPNHFQARVRAAGSWRTNRSSWVRRTCLHQLFQEKHSASAGVFFFVHTTQKFLKVNIHSIFVL